MADLIATAEVEELLTPEMCRAAAFQTPATKEEREHVEALYHETFEGNQTKTRQFLSAAGDVLKKAKNYDLGNPSRFQAASPSHSEEAPASQRRDRLASV